MYPTWWEYPKGRIKVKRGDVVRVGRGSIIIGAVETGHLRAWLEGVMNARYEGDLDIMWGAGNVPEEVVRELDRNGEKGPVDVKLAALPLSGADAGEGSIRRAAPPTGGLPYADLSRPFRAKNVSDMVFEEGMG